jgi:hypothetical protein
VSHRLVSTTYLHKDAKVITWHCVDKSCDTTGRVEATPHAAADDVYAEACAIHNDPDLFDGLV